MHSLEQSIVVWDLLAEKQVASIQGTDGELRSIAFLPCGTRMASASMNKRVRLWRRKDPDDSESWLHATEVCGFISGVSTVTWNPAVFMEFATRCQGGSAQA